MVGAKGIYANFNIPSTKAGRNYRSGIVEAVLPIRDMHYNNVIFDAGGDPPEIDLTANFGRGVIPSDVDGGYQYYPTGRALNNRKAHFIAKYNALNPTNTIDQVTARTMDKKWRFLIQGVLAKAALSTYKYFFALGDMMHCSGKQFMHTIMLIKN